MVKTFWSTKLLDLRVECCQGISGNYEPCKAAWGRPIALVYLDEHKLFDTGKGAAPIGCLIRAVNMRSSRKSLIANACGCTASPSMNVES